MTYWDQRPQNPKTKRNKLAAMIWLVPLLISTKRHWAAPQYLAAISNLTCKHHYKVFVGFTAMNDEDGLKTQHFDKEHYYYKEH